MLYNFSTSKEIVSQHTTPGNVTIGIFILFDKMPRKNEK